MRNDGVRRTGNFSLKVVGVVSHTLPPQTKAFSLAIVSGVRSDHVSLFYAHKNCKSISVTVIHLHGPATAELLDLAIRNIREVRVS